MAKAIEYIRLGPSQQTYGKKNLLHCEMELLNTIKTYQRYKKIKKETKALKSLLRRTVTELYEELKTLDSLLPHTKHNTSRPFQIDKTQRKRKDLEDEIDEIKRKISELQ
jgi:predicted phage gp36 major capsid-like protein